MVLLTITPSILNGLQEWKQLSLPEQGRLQRNENDPSLDDATVGNPISHGQIVDLWSALRDVENGFYSLEKLLQGSRVFVPPPPPKPEPSKEFQALMARLRRDEEQRAYDRMANPISTIESFSQRFPTKTNMAQAFAEVNRPGQEADLGDDGVTYDEVHRQMMLILNFMVSIIGVAATLWIVARWWSTPARLFLTMAGSALVGIAEFTVYSGYVWHLGEAKRKDKTLKEVKKVVQTWVVGAGDDDGGAGEKDAMIAVDGKKGDGDENLRRRRKEEAKE